MVEVISRGVRPSEKIIDVRCTVCTSVLRFTIGEAKVHDDQRDGLSYEIECPVCNARVFSSGEHARNPDARSRLGLNNNPPISLGFPSARGFTQK